MLPSIHMPGEDGPVYDSLRGSPALRSDTSDHAGWWALSHSGVLNIYGELGAEDVRRIAGNATVRQIQFARKFTVSTAMLRLLAEHLLPAHPGIAMRLTLNGFDAFNDLDFLEHLPGLRALFVDGSHPIGLEPIRDFVALESLRVGGLGTSLHPLQHYASVKTFGFHERIRDLETIGTFTNLQRLTIGGRSPDSLSFLGRLTHLTSLAFEQVAPKRFEDLCLLPALEEVSIWRAKKLEVEALSPLNGITMLDRLTLKELPRITSLEWLTNPRLRVLEIEDLKGLKSYAALAGLSNLEVLLLKDEIGAAQLSELASAPRLKEVHIFQARLTKLQPALDRLTLPFAIKAI
jgi:hypothetical protein